MAKSRRTIARDNKLRALMGIHLDSLCAMLLPKRDLETSIDAWQLKEMFKFLHENPKIAQVRKKMFYSITKTQRASLLMEGQNVEEE